MSCSTSRRYLWFGKKSYISNPSPRHLVGRARSFGSGLGTRKLVKRARQLPASAIPRISVRVRVGLALDGRGLSECAVRRGGSLNYFRSGAALIPLLVVCPDSKYIPILPGFRLLRCSAAFLLLTSTRLAFEWTQDTGDLPQAKSWSS